MTCCRQWWPRMVKNIKSERVSPRQVRMRDLGLLYQVTAYTALWDEIGQIWSKVAHNCPVFVIVSRYDRLGSYLSLYHPFWAILALPVRFDHIKIKVPCKRERPERIHNYTKCRVIARCDQLWPHLTQHSQFWSVFNKCDWNGYVWLMTPTSGIYCIIWYLMVPYGLL